MPTDWTCGRLGCNRSRACTHPAVRRPWVYRLPQKSGTSFRAPIHHRCGGARRGVSMMATTTVPVGLVVNGIRHELHVEPRWLLVDVIRDVLGLTGTHIGCEHGVCGTCTVLMNGETVRSCLMLAVGADGAEIATVEGLASGDRMHPLQTAFREAQGLQCGFCTAGMLMVALELLGENPNPSEQEIREAISANLCRCTGYQGIVDAVRLAATSSAATR